MMTEDEQRAAVVAAARSWIGTPYHHRARVKGAGVDCIMLLVAAFEDAGVLSGIKVPLYVGQWHLHRDAEKYLQGLMGYCRELGPDEKPQAGDIALWKFGRVYSHGAIITDWPRLVHAWLKSGCVEDDYTTTQFLQVIGERNEDEGKPRPMRFFSHWGRGDEA
jgi:cell wall-associated NlpC family hydrolase